MTSGRTFTAFAEQDHVAKRLVEALPSLKGNVERYRESMHQLGEHLADGILEKLNSDINREICVICSVEDADFLARGLIEEIEKKLQIKTNMMCLWNERLKTNGITVSPVLRTYEESFPKADSIFVIVKSIISGACVVKTNLTKALTTSSPNRVFVAAPVMREGAENRLAAEFPKSISEKFEFVHFATDSETSEDGEFVIPGIGGSVYELLGLGDKKTKNKFIPSIVKERRRRAYPEILPT